MTISTHPPDIGQGSNRAASLGRVVECVAGRENHTTRPDTEGRTGHVARATAAGGTDTLLYEIRVQCAGLDITIGANAVASTPTGVRDPLLAAIQASPLLMAFLKRAAAVSTDAFDLEAIEGKTLVVTFPTNPSGDLSVAYTAAAASPQYFFGRAVEVVAATLPAGAIGDGVRRTVAIAGAVLDLTETYNSTDTFVLNLLANGLAESITWTGDTDTDTTDLAAKVALEASEFIVSATIESTGVITIVGTSGVQLLVVSATVTGSAALAVVLNTQADALPTFALVRQDMATPLLDSMPQTIPDGPLPGSGVACAGPSGTTVYAVEAPGASIAGTTVYVETDTGADWGRLFDTPSATRTQWPDPKWVGLDADDPTLAHIRL